MAWYSTHMVALIFGIGRIHVPNMPCAEGGAVIVLGSIRWIFDNNVHPLMTTVYSSYKLHVQQCHHLLSNYFIPFP